MQMKPVAEIKNLPEILMWTDVNQIRAYFEEIDWTHSMLASLKHKDEKVSMSLVKGGQEIYIKCKGVSKCSFEILMEDLEIRRLSIKQKDEGIKLRVGPIKVMAQSVKLIQRI